MPRIVGEARAAELLYSGSILTATDAADIGMVNRVVAPESFAEEVAAYASSVATAGPRAVRALKQSLRLSPTVSLEEALRREAVCQAMDYAGEEFLEGINAAREKRKPQF